MPQSGGSVRSECDNDRERAWSCPMELPVGDSATSPCHIFSTVNTSPISPTGFYQPPSFTHGPRCASQDQIMPELLLPSNCITSKFGPESESTPTVQHHLWRTLLDFSAAESKVDTETDCARTAAHFTSESEYPENQLSIEQLQTDMDHDTFDTYDDLTFTHEDGDPEELFDYRLEFVEGTESPQSGDVESEEVPSWYRYEVSSTGSTSVSQKNSSTLDEGLEEHRTRLKGKEIQAASVFGETKESSLGGGYERGEIHFSRLDEDTAVAECNDETTLLECETSTPRPKLNVDLQRALILSQGSETVRKAFNALYQFTEASSVRGCFIPKTEIEAKTSEGNVSAAMLIPKEEPVQMEFDRDSLQARPSPIQMVQVKEEKESHWNLVSSSMDTESYRKVRNLLKRLEEAWITSTKEREKVKESGRGTLRFDLTHLTVASGLKRAGLWLNEENRPIGHCPGVPLGACFNYRIEMSIIGLHRAVQNGIGVVPADFSPYRRPVATSVVLLTNKLYYKDDRDMGEKVTYSGQGGLCGKTNKYKDQKLGRGNLALANSFDLGVPIRLIRGHRDKNSRTGRLYSYDGLYKVTDVNYKTGVHGNRVYLFTMVRLPGQGDLPIPSKAAMIYKGKNDIDAYLRSVRRSRRRKFHTPVLKIKSSTASGFEPSTNKSLFAPTKTEFATVVPKDEPACEALVSVLCTRSASSTKKYASCPSDLQWVSVDISSEVTPESSHRRAKGASSIRFDKKNGP